MSTAMGRGSASRARNIATAGSSGVVTTFRTEIVPSSPSATRSVKVPPTSTPTRITTPPTRNAEVETRNSNGSSLGVRRSSFCSAFHVPRSAFSAASLPCLRRQQAGEPDGRQRSEEHTSELQSHSDLVCRLLLEKKKK